MKAIGENGLAVLAVAALLLGCAAWTVWLPGKLYLWMGRLGGALMFWGASGVFGAAYLSVLDDEKLDPSSAWLAVPVAACIIGVVLGVYTMAPYWDDIRDGVRERLAQEQRDQEEK